MKGSGANTINVSSSINPGATVSGSFTLNNHGKVTLSLNSPGLPVMGGNVTMRVKTTGGTVVMDSLWARERVRGYRIGGDGHTIEWWNGAFEWVEGSLNDTMPELRSLPWATRRRFLVAIRFLKQNFLNPCILANDCYRWEFNYRDRSVPMYDDNRYIASGATKEDVQGTRRSEPSLRKG